MNIYLVRDSHPDRILNTRYFWLDTKKDIQDPASDLSCVLLVSNDWKFASHQGKSYRVCELGIDDEDPPFVKVWEKDPFQDCLPEYMQPLPPHEEAEYAI